jgi:predicted nucleic acid-binding protein
LTAFLDTNVLLYAVGINPGEERKQRIAEDLVAPMDWRTSVQVIQEFFVNAIRGGRSAALPEEIALAFVELWRERPAQEMTLALFDEAVAVHRRHGYSYWDSAIIAAAKAQGCDTVWSEDMDDGRIVEGMRVANPFQ